MFKCAKDPLLNKYILGEIKLNIIHHMTNFLKPFKLATKLFSASSYPPFAKAMPIHEELVEGIELVSPLCSYLTMGSTCDDGEDYEPNRFISTQSFSSACNEVQEYLGTSCKLKSSVPLKYWLTNSSNFPILSCMAHRYHLVLATCVPSEQTYQKTDYCGFRASRNSKALVFLKFWAELL